MNFTQGELIKASQHKFRNVHLGEVCFISDLHLSNHMPETLAQFEHFCKTTALEYDTLIILGDLFEYWLGDDTYQHNSAALRVIKTLNQLHAAGKKIGFIVGNRDFLIREKFAQHAHMTLLPDPCIIQINRQKVLLSHGDLLCTDDTDYQRFRRIVQKSWLQNLFLTIPLSLRNKLAQHLRHKSQNRWQQSTDAQREHLVRIQDASIHTITQWFKQFQVQTFIHGHTHRPSTHLTQNTIRLVLPDWNCDDIQNICWGYITWSRDSPKPKLHHFTTLKPIDL